MKRGKEKLLYRTILTRCRHAGVGCVDVGCEELGATRRVGCADGGSALAATAAETAVAAAAPGDSGPTRGSRAQQRPREHCVRREGNTGEGCRWCGACGHGRRGQHGRRTVRARNGVGGTFRCVNLLVGRSLQQQQRRRWKQQQQSWDRACRWTAMRGRGTCRSRRRGRSAGYP